MWRLKQLIPKEQAGLEGKNVEVGSLRLQIRSVIAEGGFSCVYLARDAQSGKQFAVKHIVCNDAESLDLVKKEVNALKALCGHPNIISLYAQTMYDMGRTKECFIVTDYCDKMMVEVLDNRGAGFFDEKQLLLIFRDICNAVYAMHCLSPPMAHRDLKAENLLMGSDGLWKLCDFGSISTNHKRFEKAAEMGIEEDVIRKHTTPAYRAPEMWDLYSRELISEKVDIWALGCLLFRMAYLKSAFDGDSKLQILNGNYRIPEQPKYSPTVTGLIKEMLNSSPEARPSALQVWQRVNVALPVECQKAAPDKAPSSAMSPDKSAHSRSPTVMPTRAPPPPPQRNIEQEVPSLAEETEHKSSPLAPRERDVGSISVSKAGALGSFWSTQYAQETLHEDSKSSLPQKNSGDLTRHHGSVSTSPQPRTQESHGSPSTGPRSMRSNFGKSRGPAGRGYTRPEEVASDENGNGNANERTPTIEAPQMVVGSERLNQSSQDAFYEFVADFQKASIFSADNAIDQKEEGQLELERLRSELKEARREKDEIVSKYEKLAAMCRSQRLEIQELKQSLQAVNSHNSKSKGFGLPSDSTSSQLKPEMNKMWDLQQGIRSSGAPFESQGWKAFDDEPSMQISGLANDSQDPSRINLFDSTKVESKRPEASKMGYSPESIQKSKSSKEDWGFRDSFASLGPAFTAGKGSGHGAIDKSSARSENVSKGGSRMASTHNHQPTTKGGARMASTHNNQPSGWSNF